MEIFEIKNLNCSVRGNRNKLVIETMDALGMDEKPSKEYLKAVCKRLIKKYKMPMNVFKRGDRLIVNIKTPADGYSTMECLHTYEVYCKYILFVKAWKQYKKLVPK